MRMGRGQPFEESTFTLKQMHGPEDGVGTEGRAGEQVCSKAQCLSGSTQGGPASAPTALEGPWTPVSVLNVCIRSAGTESLSHLARSGLERHPVF